MQLDRFPKTLFGTMDADDAAYYDEQITELKNKQNKMQNLFKQQTSIIENTVHVINATASKTNAMYRSLKDKIEESIKFINAFGSNISDQINNNRMELKVNGAVQILNLLISTLGSNQNNLLDIITMGQYGKLHPLVISPLRLVKELSTYQTYLDDLKFPVQPVLENAQILYSLTDVNVFYFNDRLSVVLLIPIVDNKMYDVMKMTSLPVLISNSSNASYAFIQPRSTHFVLDSTRQHYFLMNKIEFSACKTFNDWFVCPQTKPLYLTHLHGGCEANLFFSSNNILESCDTRIFRLIHPMFIQLAKTNSWIFATAKSEHIDLNCQGQEKISLQIKHSGICRLHQTARHM